MSYFARIKQSKSLKEQRKIVCLTADSVPMTHTLYPYCDLLLVGDTATICLYGMDSTQGANLDMLNQHGQTLIRRRKKSVVIIYLPTGNYKNSPGQALKIARRAPNETGTDGVKLEDGCQIARNIARLVESYIEVLAHINLLPQRTTLKSGFGITGGTAEESEQLANDSSALYNTGASSIVMEGIVEPVAASTTTNCPVPKISVCTSQVCDDGILVTEDILGLYDGFTPKFVEKFTELQSNIGAAAADFHKAVVNETFPLKQHLFYPKN